MVRHPHVWSCMAMYGHLPEGGQYAINSSTCSTGLTLLKSRLEHVEPLSGESFPEKRLLVLTTTAEGAHPLKHVKCETVAGFAVQKREKNNTVTGERPIIRPEKTIFFATVFSRSNSQYRIVQDEYLLSKQVLPTYHAARKVEYQLLNRSNSQLMYLYMYIYLDLSRHTSSSELRLTWESTPLSQLAEKRFIPPRKTYRLFSCDNRR